MFLSFAGRLSRPGRSKKCRADLCQTLTLLLTPPFTQLNTPYPATAYLKGFLNTRGLPSVQADLGMEVTLAIFSQQGLAQAFHIAQAAPEPSINARRILALAPRYLATITPAISFLQGKNSALAHLICGRAFLPEASRFAQAGELDHAFGTMGLQDHARHLATLYLEDLADFISECVDPHFGFSRYAEKLGRSANTFDELYAALNEPLSFTDCILTNILQQKLEATQPKLVAVSVPFPGNLLSAFRCAQWIRQHWPGVRVAMGGGFANTELRTLADPRVLDFFHYITLDDGEAPIEQLIRHVAGEVGEEALKRTFLLKAGGVHFIDNSDCKDYRQGQVGTPDYEGLHLDNYISAIEVTNPMHALWTAGQWLKLTMAHGCYWGKCTFCDVSLDYIGRYEPLTAGILADRMEELMRQTGRNGFHFVDEAAPPALMRELAIEILRRGLTVSWWANIRFEKAFTRDLCVLLKASGCIAVSGGLEVAGDRLLALINKGITVAQVARVMRHFHEAGILVHAYLMYGFPTQTAQETIDSMEMVRQLFAAGVLSSGFWHRFAMTAHSPVGLAPKDFQVKALPAANITFANNDVAYEDPTGADHDTFSFGLKKSLLNWMNGIGLDQPLHTWFEGVKAPRTSVAKDFIATALEEEGATHRPTARLLYTGPPPQLQIITKSKKGAQWEQAVITIEAPQKTIAVTMSPEQGTWLKALLDERSNNFEQRMTMQDVTDHYAAAGLEDFELFSYNKPVNGLWRAGLLVV